MNRVRFVIAALALACCALPQDRLAGMLDISARVAKKNQIQPLLNFPRPQTRWIDGSHLFPFEHPNETAAEVIRWIERFEKGRPTPAPAGLGGETACL